jgi:peptidoglycan hydrolase-like amidase
MNVVYAAIASLPLLIGNPVMNRIDHVQTFTVPVDAVSASFEDVSAQASIRGFDGKNWTEWQALEVDDEQDPLSRESNLVTFPRSVTQVEVKGGTNVELHPIIVSHAPVYYDVASLRDVSGPAIISRSQWGADESLRIASAQTQKPPSDPLDEAKLPNGNGDVTTNNRVEDCNAAVRDHPDEFKTSRTVRMEGGAPLRWPEQYSKQIKMLVVHHTAEQVTGDTRSAVERMRAIYQYHTVNRGWGDIGYNYVIDEAGHIYEGRAGGDNVVAGHAYCNNVGTLGIALMGNFEVEVPPQEQVKALQQLLRMLADKYKIDLDKSVQFHGKTRSPISVHGDLLSTSCPGFYLRGVMDQVRAHVMSGDIASSVVFPVKPVTITTSDKPYVDHSAQRRAQRQSAAVLQIREGLYAVTPVELTGNPGQEVLVSLKYVAGTDGAKKGKAIGAIQRSEDGVGVWLDRNGAYERLRSSLTLPEPLNAWEALTMQLKISFPLKEGASSVTIGTVTYTLQASGRRMRTPTDRVPEVTTSRTTLRKETVMRTTVSSSSRSSVSSRSSSSLAPRSSESGVRSSSSTSNQQPVTGNSLMIRILLNYPDNNISAAVTTPDSYVLKISGDECIQTQEGREIARGKVVRISTKTFTIYSWQHLQNRFRGTLECRVINHKIALINELPLEDYLKGIAEEPDSEPFEKQKAFAIAARSYALHYMGTDHRKFPGMPYDGTDNPVNFQKYGGLAFEEESKKWVQAVQETAGQVLVKDGSVIRAPYFHSDDGRTRSAEELGWLSFPNSEIYYSKPDPWCKDEVMAGHGVGMSGCGAEGQAREGKTFAEILSYYYPGADIRTMTTIAQ